MNYLVVFNPVANRQRKRRLQQLVAFLTQRQIPFSLYPTSAILSDTKQYFKNHLHEYSDLIVVGGDGTLHQVINCLDGNRDIRVGLLPAGTGNDFARWLYGENRNHVAFILETLTAEQSQLIKLGCCQFGNGDKRYFHNVLGFGFDALIAKELKNSKGWFKSLGYVVKAIQRIPFYKEPRVEVEIDGKSIVYNNLITTVANNEYFGNGMKINPGTKPTETHMSVCRIAQLPLLTKLSHILRLFKGSHITKEFVDYQKLQQSLHITSIGVDIEADGEYLGQSPVVITHKPSALNIKKVTSD